MAYKKKDTEAILKNVRFTFPHLDKPYSSEGDEEKAKYSVTLLIPKDNTEALTALKEAMNKATEQGIKSKWNGKKPAKVHNTLHDGDGVRPNGEPFGEECKGCYVITVSSNKAYPPAVFNEAFERLDNQGIIETIYSGCWGQVLVNVFPYLNKGRAGISAGLSVVQKTRDDEALAGVTRASAADIFGGGDIFGNSNDNMFDDPDDDLPFSL